MLGNMSKPVEYSWIVRIQRVLMAYLMRSILSVSVIPYRLSADMLKHLRSLKGVTSVCVFKKFDNL